MMKYNHKGSSDRALAVVDHLRGGELYSWIRAWNNIPWLSSLAETGKVELFIIPPQCHLHFFIGDSEKIKKAHGKKKITESEAGLETQVLVFIFPSLSFFWPVP